MELLDLIIVFVLSSIPWYFAFVKYEKQPSGRSIFIKSLIKSFLIALLLFVLFFFLALNNRIPTINRSGSYSAGEIRQAIYLFIGFLMVVVIYIGSGIHCYQMAKERYWVLNPPPPKKKKIGLKQ
jgi:hypothetical protein